jgi:hypothetical protein
MAKNSLNNQVPLTDAQMQEVMEDLDKVALVLVFLKILSADQIRKMRKLGIKYEGYVNEVEETAVSFPVIVPQTRPFADFKDNRTLQSQMLTIFNKVASIHQGLVCSRMLLGHDILSTTDTYYNSIKRSVKNDVALAEAYEKIAEMLSKSGPAEAILFTIPAGGMVTVRKVIPGSLLINKGTTVINIKANETLKAKSKEIPFVIDPMNSVCIPKGWTVIDITNQSASNDGQASVRVE